ncbi:MAG: nuclear transport factor 2 family protein [Chloroflexi bacterium]|nr:nuclear transport factor 2 family protein [Chloroflexota bacterium]
MSNIDAVNALLTAIHFDRFAEIEARHAPDAVFQSFRGPTLRNSVAISDWHKAFLRDYADCTYTEIEYIEEGNTVVVRATIEAKAPDWRPFSQRVVEVFEFSEMGVRRRRLYAMLPDLEFEKPVQQALDNALGYRGGSAGATRKAVEEWLAAYAGGDIDGVRAMMHDKPALIDGVYGAAAGLDAAMGVAGARPKPLFGTVRPTGLYAGEHTALLEEAVDPARPRQAVLFRLVDGKIAVVEVYWMLREIGVDPFAGRRERHRKQVILPI